MRKILAVFLLAVAALAAGGARADVPASGTFVATTACPAVQSIRKNTNPGNVMLTPQQGYQVVSGNKTPPTHYLLVVPGATPDHRWAAVECGTLSGAAAQPANAGASTTATPAPAPTSGGGGQATGNGLNPVATTADSYVLAVSWEPGFCSDHNRSVECTPEAAADATHFVLHGLWRDPYPRPYSYCQTDGPKYRTTDHDHDWEHLPDVTLTAAVQSHLGADMPGTQSKLERHEWIVHGLCSGLSMDAFFDRSAALLDAVNATALKTFIVGRIGQRVTLQDVQAQVEQIFGAGTGQNVNLDCEGKLLSEIHIGLKGDVTGSGKLSDLIADGYSPAWDSHHCVGGTVAAIGAH